MLKSIGNRHRRGGGLEDRGKERRVHTDASASTGEDSGPVIPLSDFGPALGNGVLSVHLAHPVVTCPGETVSWT